MAIFLIQGKRACWALTLQKALSNIKRWGEVGGRGAAGRGRGELPSIVMENEVRKETGRKTTVINIL